MSITILFFAGLAAIAGWWLWREGLAAKPWLEEGVLGEVPSTRPSSVSTAKVGLGVFLAVVGCLFALTASAYLLRMQMSNDWRSLPVPKILWFNTGVLTFSSIALHRAQVAARNGRVDRMRAGLLAGAFLAVAFLAGQLLAWQQLDMAGYYVASNPANAFFYMLTALHGLHLLGGLVALARPIAKMQYGFDLDQVRPSIELCAIYWHFLLLVWFALFSLLLLT